MGRILDELKEVEDAPQDYSLGFGEPDTSPMPFSSDNFHEISHEISPEPAAGSRITFIDGGNAELLASPGASLHFVRIFHTAYKGGNRVSCGSDEFYALAKAVAKDSRVFYDAKLFSSRVRTLTDTFFSTEFSFDALDKDLRDGRHRFSISKVPSNIRRLAELSTALLMVKDSGAGDIIVLDGDFGAKLPEEHKLLSALRRVAFDRKVFVCALSKTSGMLSSVGVPVSVLLEQRSPGGMWYYHPVIDTSNSPVKREVYFARFHPGSGYVFKFETFDSRPESELVFSLLAANSRDPVFLGYPYGLVEADRFARVSNRECECLRTMFMAKAGRDWKHLDSASKAIDAHSVLDSI